MPSFAKSLLRKWNGEKLSPEPDNLPYAASPAMMKSLSKLWPQTQTRKIGRYVCSLRLLAAVVSKSKLSALQAAMGSSVMSTTPPPMNQGDDISGTLVSIGRSVNLPFPIGSRVAAFHRMLTPHGSYAEYAIAPASTTFLIPDNISFEQAAALPLSGMTAALALYRHLDLPKPEPWPQNSGTDKPGVLIYGGASAVGAYALQFVKLSGLSPIITVVGKGGDFVRSLQVTDSNHIIDYRNENVTERVNQILGGKKLKYAFDAISHNNTWEKILEAMRGSDGKYAEGAKLNMVDPPPGDFLANWPKDVEFSRTYVSSAYGEAHKFRDAEEAKGDGEFATEMYRSVTAPRLYCPMLISSPTGRGRHIWLMVDSNHTR